MTSGLRLERTAGVARLIFDGQSYSFGAMNPAKSSKRSS